MTTQDVVPKRTMYIVVAVFTVGLIVMGYVAVRTAVTIREVAEAAATDAATEQRCRVANEFRDFNQGRDQERIDDQIEIVDTFREAESFHPELIPGWETFSSGQQTFILQLASNSATTREANEEAATVELRRLRDEAYVYMRKFPLQDCNGDGHIDEDEFPPAEGAPVVVTTPEDPPTTPVTTGES